MLDEWDEYYMENRGSREKGKERTVFILRVPLDQEVFVVLISGKNGGLNYVMTMILLHDANRLFTHSSPS